MTEALALNTPASISIEGNTLLCEGYWVNFSLNDLLQHVDNLPFPSDSEIILDAHAIEKMDSAGLWLLADIYKKMSAQQQVQLVGLSSKQQALFKFMLKQATYSEPEEPPLSYTVSLGQKAQNAWNLILDFVGFLGEISVNAGIWLKNPKNIRWNALFQHIESTGYQALPIIGLLSFLIGLVLAYQVGNQLQSYGASIYVVDLLGLSLLREFSPLLTAIIVAGRSGAAFAAQIGTMKLNEEIDILKTMGLSPTEVLVLPKLFGLLIALPLLTIFAICFSLLGGMVMAKAMLGIPFEDFLARFGDIIQLKTLLLGEIKTPFFAALIASIGCFQGFLVNTSAASVGERTTISVVHSIFMIIVTDAAFSIIFSMLGL